MIGILSYLLMGALVGYLSDREESPVHEKVICILFWPIILIVIAFFLFKDLPSDDDDGFW